MKTPAPGSNRGRAAVIEAPDDTAACTRSRTLIAERDLYRLASQWLAYNPDDGVFTWRVNRGSGRAGKRAGSVGSCGRTVIGLDGRQHRADHIAVLLTTATWPHGPVIHRNAMRTDDRLANLLVLPTAPGWSLAPHIVAAMPPRAQKFARATLAQARRRRP